MKNKLAKLIEVLPWLSLNPGVSAAQTARHFGITEKDLLDLLQLAVFTGPGQGGGDLVDIDFEDEENLYVIDAKGLERPIKFDRQTALQIIGGLHYLMQLPAVVDTKSVESLLAKLQDSFGLTNMPVEYVKDLNLDQTLEQIGKAINQKSVLSIQYASATSGKVTQRNIEPKSISINANTHYLKAFCNAALDFRLFRVDRIVAIEILERKQENEVDSQIGLVQGPIRVRIKTTPSVAVEFDERFITSKSELSSSEIELELAVHDLDWISREILASKGQIEPVEPEQLKALVQAKIAKWKTLNSVS